MTWHTAAELADMKLPGLPSTESAMIRRAKREGWQARRRQARGGGWEYHIDCLPQQARAAILLQQHAPAAASQAQQKAEPQADEAEWLEGLWRRYKRLPDHLKDRAKNRLSAVQAVQTLIDAGVGKTDAYAHVAARFDVSTSRVRAWWRTVEGHRGDAWLPMLADKYVAGGKKAEITPQAWEVYKADYLRPAKPAHAACYRRLQRKAEAEGWTIPDQRTLQRWIEQMPEELVILARDGEQALKRRFPSQRRDRSVFHALQAVNADGHTFDVRVRWADGTIGRPVMLAWQDLYSGKILSWRIGQTENADLVRLSLGDLVETYGIPDDAYLDNGRAFASKWLTGQMANRFRFKVKAEEPAGILTTLGVRVHWVTPYHGQAKPIERAFRDLCEEIAKHPECEGAYVGNAPQNKPANYGEKAAPIGDFIDLVRREIAHHNARPNRRTDVCEGARSFDQAFTESYAQSPIKMPAASQRDLWLLAAEGVTIRQDGTIHLDGNRYWSEVTGRNAGRKVTVRFDPQGLHEGVHVYGQNGAYLGAAACFEAVGFNDRSKAREQQKARQAWTKAHKEMLAAERRMSTAELAKGLQDSGQPDEPAEPQSPRVVRPVFTGRGGAAPAIEANADQQEQNNEDVAVRALRGLQLIQGGGDGTADD